MAINKIVWFISTGVSSQETIALPFKSKGKNNMQQAEQELEAHMAKRGITDYSIMYWDWIDPDNKWVQCKVCGTSYGSVWDKKGGCPTCQENKAREKQKQEQQKWKEERETELKNRKFRWWGRRKQHYD